MGYVKIDRGILDHWIYQDPAHFKTWFEMIARARFEKEPMTKMIDGELITVNYGEFIFGRISWADRIGIGEQRLRTLMKHLEREQMIQLVKTYKKCSVWQIVNYEKFNHRDNQRETLDGTGIDDDANQRTNQQLTSGQPAANQQLTTKKELKNLIIKARKKKQKGIRDKPRTRTRRSYEPTSLEYILAERLFERIKRNHDHFKPPNLQNWADDMRLAIENDGRSVDDLENVIDWATGHSFWGKRILSTRAIRDKFDDLKIEMDNKGGRTGGDAYGKARTDRRGRDSQKLDKEKSRTFSL